MIQPRPQVGASAEASDVDLWALCEAEWSPAQGGFEDERARDWVRSVRADTSDRGVCETCEVRRGGVRGYERARGAKCGRVSGRRRGWALRLQVLEERRRVAGIAPKQQDY